MSEPIELEITEILQKMGIAKIHRRVDSDDTNILIIIPNDTTSCKSIEFKIDDTPENTAYNCESACRDYLDLKIISALQVFITNNWEQIKASEEEEGSTTEAQSTQKTVKTSYQPRFTDERLNFLAEAILIDGEPYWLISEAGAIRVSKDAIPTGKRRKVEPLAKDQYLTKAYSFSSEEEVKHYVELATNLNLDGFYDMIQKVVKKYIDSNRFHISIVTLSIIFTYYQDRVGTTHYLFFVGPPNCGKTNNLTLFEEMAYRCMGSSGLTAANIYEFLGGKEEGMGTIAEDEADDIDESRDKMKVYKNGSRKGKPYHQNRYKLRT